VRFIVFFVTILSDKYYEITTTNHYYGSDYRNPYP
jgi:hypothetical protein